MSRTNNEMEKEVLFLVPDFSIIIWREAVYTFYSNSECYSDASSYDFWRSIAAVLQIGTLRSRSNSPWLVSSIVRSRETKKFFTSSPKFTSPAPNPSRFPNNTSERIQSNFQPEEIRDQSKRNDGSSYNSIFYLCYNRQLFYFLFFLIISS